MDKIFKAMEFATICHHNQVRKGSKLPYIIHPMEVSMLLSKINCSNELIKI